MANGICGSICTMTMDGSNVTAHSFTIDVSATETDTRAFGDGVYGDFTICARSGSITVNSYERPDYDPGDAVQFSANVGSEIITLPAVVVSQNINVDSKGLFVEFSTVLRATGAGTIV